jgi:signal transduction histidine kinase
VSVNWPHWRYDSTSGYLVHNAAYWVSTNDAGKDRRLAVILDSQGRSVIVADNGPGVSKEEVPLLFEPFFSMKEGGSGLGLYIAAELARAAGGILSCERAVGGDSRLPAWTTGAVFEFTVKHVERGEDG